MYELKTVVENGITHFEIHKKDGIETFIESFDYNEYFQAVKILIQLNSN